MTRQRFRDSAQFSSASRGSRAGSLQSVATVLVMAGLLLAAEASTGVRADDTIDRELLKALEETPPADTPQQIIPRLIDSTQSAATRLQEGQLDEATQQLQAQILADIDALLEQATPPLQPPPGGSPSQSQQQPQKEQDPSRQKSPPGTDGQDAATDVARESEERSTPGELTDAERERRLGLSTAAWGHLPPKVREQMRSAFSEEYLPQYDALVRQYYEALARRRRSNR